MNIIPKNVLQVSKERIPQKDVDAIMMAFPGWKYYHFINEKECLEYIRNNPVPGLPKADRVFLSYMNGAHKADFFRYYFLYLNGGAYIDSDLIIYENIENILDGSSFVTCEATSFDFLKNSIFQGFIVCTKKNPITYAALMSMYNMVDPKITFCNSGTLEGYLALTKKLYRIIHDDFKHVSVKLLSDKCFRYTSPIDQKEYIGFYVNDGSKVVGVHWQQEKVVSHDYENIYKWEC